MRHAPATTPTPPMAMPAATRPPTASARLLGSHAGRWRRGLFTDGGVPLEAVPCKHESMHQCVCAVADSKRDRYGTALDDHGKYHATAPMRLTWIVLASAHKECTPLP